MKRPIFHNPKNYKAEKKGEDKTDIYRIGIYIRCNQLKKNTLCKSLSMFVNLQKFITCKDY